MKSFVHLFVFLAMLFFVWLGFSSQSHAGGEDGVQHHLIARYVPQHPQNLTDLWGKPLYTLLSFPFAQFGFKGSLLFNILAGIFVAWLTFLSAKKLKLKFAFLSIVFLLFAPEYFYNIPSAVTEITFSMVLIGSVYLLLCEKPIWSAFLISFIPYARTEGNAMLPLFALAFIFLKNYKALPFLLTGSLLLSLGGFFYYRDIFWIWNQHPYGDASSIYGSGSFWHYYAYAKFIWGIPLIIIISLSSLLFAGKLFKNISRKHEITQNHWVWTFAIFGSFYVYLFGHSYVWWKGVSASLGLIRVMAGTMPLAALIALLGLNQILSVFNPKLKVMHGIIALGFVYLVFQSCFMIHRKLPFSGDEERKLILEAGDWYRNSDFYPANKVYYFAPSVADAFLVDPFSSQRGYLESALQELPSMSEKTLIVWDGHFGPNECRLPKDSLLNQPNLKLIARFKPQSEIKSLNEHSYEILLFLKEKP